VTGLGAAYSLMQFLFVPLWGRLSDRFGRRPIILVSIVAAAVGYVGFGLAGSLGGLYAARMLSGLGNANIATAQAILADITAPEDRARAMGLVGAAFGLGFILGPAVGGILSQWGAAVPAFVAAGLSVANWVFAWFVLPETLPAEARGQDKRAGHPLDPRSLFGALRRPGIGPMLVLVFVTVTSLALMEQTLGLFIERAWVPEAMGAALGSPELEAAHRRAALLTTGVFVLVGVVATIVQGGLIGPLNRRFGERRLIRVGLVAAGVGMIVTPISGQAGSYALLLVASGLLALGMGLCTPALNSMISRAVSSHEQGRILGINQSLGSLARVLGPAAAGPLFAVTRDLPFLLGGVGLFLALVLARDAALGRPMADEPAGRE
jgi:multidrug resistance protein